jgi:histidine phosphotransferase ChpT
MSRMIEFRVLELLSARLCHELVSPVGAINNGVELLGEEDPDFVRDAIGLIGQSARTAVRRLQFYRFAYGTSVSAGGAAPVGGRELAQGFFDGTRLRCDWAADMATLPVDWQRLACNMLVLAGEVLPRGGVLGLRSLRDGRSGIEVAAEGEGVNITLELRAALAEGAAVEELTSRTIQAYFTARLAAELGVLLALAVAEPRRALFRASAAV